MFQEKFPVLYKIVNDDDLAYLRPYWASEAAFLEKNRDWLPNGSLFLGHMHDSDILGIERIENKVLFRISDIHSCDFFGSLLCELYGKGKETPDTCPLEVVFEFSDVSIFAFYKITESDDLEDSSTEGEFGYHAGQILDLRPGECHMAFLVEDMKTREIDHILEIKSRDFRIVDKIRESFVELFENKYDYYLDTYLKERESILKISGRDRLNYIRDLIKSNKST